MNVSAMFNFEPGEIWGLQLPSPKGIQQIRIRIVGQNAFGVGFQDVFDEENGVQFLSGSVPFMAKRLFTAEQARQEDMKRAAQLAVVEGAMKQAEDTTRTIIAP